MARVEDLSVEEIRKRFLEKGEPVSAQILTRLQRDKRQGVRNLYESLKKRFERDRDERQRLDAMRYFEKLLWKSGIRDIAGVDEAGVAPLAGPVVGCPRSSFLLSARAHSDESTLASCLAAPGCVLRPGRYERCRNVSR